MCRLGSEIVGVRKVSSPVNKKAAVKKKTLPAPGPLISLVLDPSDFRSGALPGETEYLEAPKQGHSWRRLTPQRCVRLECGGVGCGRRRISRRELSGWAML